MINNSNTNNYNSCFANLSFERNGTCEKVSVNQSLPGSGFCGIVGLLPPRHLFCRPSLLSWAYLIPGVNLLFSFHIFWSSLFHLYFAFPPFNILLSVSRCLVHSGPFLTSDSFHLPIPTPFIPEYLNSPFILGFSFILLIKNLLFSIWGNKSEAHWNWCVQFLLSEGRVTFTECHSACSRRQRAQQGRWASISCQGPVLSHHTTHTASMTTFSDLSPWPNGVRMTSLWQSAGDVAMAP